MAAIFQTTFSYAFSGMKMYGLAPARWQAIISTSDGKTTNAYMHHSDPIQLIDRNGKPMINLGFPTNS